MQDFKNIMFEPHAVRQFTERYEADGKAAFVDPDPSKDHIVLVIKDTVRVPAEDRESDIAPAQLIVERVKKVSQNTTILTMPI
jgi:hypothetical protein